MAPRRKRTEFGAALLRGVLYVFDPIGSRARSQERLRRLNEERLQHSMHSAQMLNLQASPAMARILEELAAVLDTDAPDVVRRAVALLKTVTEAEQTGHSPALIDKEGNVVARLTGI